MNTSENRFREGESVEKYMQRIGMAGKDIPQPARKIRQDIDATLNVEAAYAAEHQRIRCAVDRVVELGIVREEVFPACQPSGRSCYLFSSAHFTHLMQGRPSIADEIRSSQIELFRLLHLIHISEANSPLFVEGRERNRAYTPFRVKRPTVSTAQGEKDIWDAIAQQHLFEDHEQLHDIIKEQYDIAVHHDHSVPIFYQYVPYKGVTGGESRETNAEGASLYNEWLAWDSAFYQRYSSFLASLKDSGKTTIATGWDENGKPVMQLAGNWLYADDIARDCENFMRYADMMRRFSEIRERDMAHFIRHTPPACVPMGFMGCAHISRLAEDVHDMFDVHVLTPTSSIAHDNKRTLAHLDDIMGNGIIKTLLDAAQTMLRQPPRS